jgi:hypothetical protein
VSVAVASGVEMFRMLEGDDAANALRAIARALEDVDEPDAGAEALEDAESAQTCSPATYTRATPAAENRSFAGRLRPARPTGGAPAKGRF